ncbi:MAG: NADH-quinone oxidoreductase subunit H [Candidatus Nezhaarchaeota archaeon]|nr:NADH-quinone oxidoreductase subunit H [Candidatus Nezhaarchaeota archaeon]MCX8141257.1 NADH-quinone oxidoreductase subunit H [Candidatus Nezhaarchaeota archaeon]MDW8049523.1 complex I subunit 1 family protein [Nitrososphaerota archaeon]
MDVHVIGLLIAHIVLVGLIAAPNIGLLLTWLHRKLGARMQWRIGPPAYQPWADIMKLLSKEMIIPGTAHKSTFLLAPPLALSSAILSLLIMPFVAPSPFGFVGDVIVVLYLMTMPAIAAMVGGSASGNPYAAIGVQREMTLLFSYELPFIAAALVPILKAGSLKFSDIVTYQLNSGPLIFTLSGFLALIVMIAVMQAKLALPPFDVPEAKTEIVTGPYVEYSGPLLAMFKLAHAIMLLVVPCFIANMFLGGLIVRSLSDPAILAIDSTLIVVKIVALVTIAAIIRFYNPRLRPDQAFGMFWKTITLIAMIALVSSFIPLPYF